jgi:hypothetical protein
MRTGAGAEGEERAMSVKIDKTVSITIDGEDVGELKNVCECARRWWEAERRKGPGDQFWVSEWDQREAMRIRNLLDRIFDA